MDVRLLGPVEVLIDGTLRPLGGPRQRAVLADLALHADRAVPVGQLIDDVWGDSPPESAVHTIAAYISRIRRALQVPGEPSRLITAGAGYRLALDPPEVDVFRFADLASRAREIFARGDPAGADAVADSALACWRGVPLADLGGAPFAAEAAHRLDDDRRGVLELLFDVRLTLGRHRELVPALETAIAEDPFRERFHAQLMTALYRSGRQSDALAAYRQARRLLVRAHGLEPGPELRALEQAILVQAPTLEDPSPAGAARVAAPIPRGPTDLGSSAPGGVDAPNGRRFDSADPAGHSNGDRSGRRRRHRAVRWAALAAVCVLVAALGTTRLPGLSPAHAAAAIPVGVSELSAGGGVAASLALPAEPGGAAAGAGSVWVTSPEAHALYRVDPLTRSRQATIGVGAGAGAVAVSGSQVWVADALAGTVSLVDARTDRVVRTVALGSEPAGLTVADGRVWVTDESASTLSVLDAATGRLLGTEPMSAPPFGIASGAGSLWVTSPADDTVTRLEPGSGAGMAISVGSGPTAVAFGLGSVWVANSLDSTVTRIDPETDSVAATIPVGDGPDALAVAGTSVWVGNRLASTLTRIDATTDAAAGRIDLDASPVAFAETGGHVWAATQPTVTGLPRGGTLRAVSSVPVPSIDPTEIYPTFGSQFWQGTYDTLVTFQRVGGSAGLQLVPDLALTMPTVTDGGTVYSFTLRPGLRYSDGSPVRPEDFRYGIERVLDLDASAGSFLTGIVGAAGCRAGSPCDLSRGITVSQDPGTVTFHLTAEDADFLDKLTFVGTAPVPASVPDHDVGGQPVPSTGPYRISRYLPGKEVDFVRNRYFREWSAAAEPAGLPDRIVWTFGASIPEEVAAIAAGRADWTYDLLPDVADLAARFPDQVRINPNFALLWASFNTRVAPFDDIRVRQAFSLAADRARLVTLLGGPDAAAPTCQILPPGIPGYQPYCPFTANPTPGGAWIRPDLPAARRLVAESGTAGMRVTVVNNSSASVVVTGFIVSVLRELGYRASMVSPPDAAYPAIVNDTRRRTQASDGSWVADYPSASDFFDLFFRCSAFRVADPADTRNASFFCMPAADRLMQAADTEKATDPAASAATWAEVDRAVTAQAPWVPLVDTTFVDFLSKRVANYQYNPAFGVVLDQLSVTRAAPALALGHGRRAAAR